MMMMMKLVGTKTLRKTSISVEVNLPTEWSGSSVQFGGSGFNGVLITAQPNAAAVPGFTAAGPCILVRVRSELWIAAMTRPIIT
jgi:hypothetical protein